MVCGNRNLRTPNMFVRILIRFLFFVPFILINGDTGDRGYNSEIAAETFGGPDVVSVHLGHEENAKQSNYRRLRRRQQYETPKIGEAANVSASLKSEFPRLTDPTNSSDNVHRNSAEDIVAAKNYDSYDIEGNKNSEKILSRRRRYLIFPPGSSVQIVYDTYHPILGYSNYLILGITAALAWELPSKPVYLDEELRETYEMGNLPLLQRKDQNVSNVTYTSTKKQSASSSAEPNTNYYYTNVPPPPKRNPFDRYYAMNPNNRIHYNVLDQNVYSNRIDGDQSHKLHYYLSYADKFMNQFKQLTQQVPKDHPLGPSGLKGLADTLTKKLASASKKTFKPMPQRKHLVHPVFKRRSVEERDELEKYDLKLHRTSRHKLYQQIETFLKSQGSDGMDCVLKTLCETGQREADEKPGTMIVELLRAVFTLPGSEERVNDPKHRMYDRAHQSKRNCHEMFPACAESIWGPKFHY